MAAMACEVSLYGQVPLSNHEQTLGILAGLAAMQPQTIYERHMLFAPIQIASNDAQPQIAKKSRKTDVIQGPPAYVRLIGQISGESFGKSHLVDAAAIRADPASWSIRVLQTPDPETKALTVRRAEERDVREHVDALLDTNQFRFVTEYCVQTQRVVSRDILLSLQRILCFVPGVPDQSSPQQSLPPLSSLTLLDPSGAFLLEAKVQVDDRTKQTLVQRAFDQLNWLKSELKGVVELRAPERLALDTRVKGV